MEDAIVPIDGWNRSVAEASTVLAMILTPRASRPHGCRARGGGAADVRLAEILRFYAVYRERMIDAQQRDLSAFREEMGAS